MNFSLFIYKNEIKMLLNLLLIDCFFFQIEKVQFLWEKWTEKSVEEYDPRCWNIPCTITMIVRKKKVGTRM